MRQGVTRYEHVYVCVCAWKLRGQSGIQDDEDGRGENGGRKFTMYGVARLGRKERGGAHEEVSGGRGGAGEGEVEYMWCKAHEEAVTGCAVHGSRTTG